MDPSQAAQNLWKAYGRPLRNIVGVGVGKGRDGSTILYVYVKNNKDVDGIPNFYEGYEVSTEVTGEISPCNVRRSTMVDGKWLLRCWEQFGKEKNVFGHPSDEEVYECIFLFPKGSKPIYVQHLLAVLWGYHPKCSLQKLVGMIHDNKLCIDNENKIRIVFKKD